MATSRRSFTAEYRVQAAHRVIDSGGTIAEVACSPLGRGPGPRGAQMRLAAASRPAWITARAADLSLPGAPGGWPPTRRVADTYLARVLSAAARDTAVAIGFLRVTGLIDPPAASVRPRALLAALGVRFPRALAPDSHRRRVPIVGLA